MEGRNYYEAYEDRYRQIHSQALRWFSEEPSPIVIQILDRYGIGKNNKILEIGCGEGRDARFLLNRGFDVLATDISSSAIGFCRRENPDWADRFQVLDCLSQCLETGFSCIYAIAVLHMLVDDLHRDRFYRFLWEHLEEDGIALIGTMGDGEMERSSDTATAFDLQDRIHEQTGRKVQIAGTSCRVVNFGTFEEEIRRNGLRILEQGMTAVLPDFPVMMYAVVKKQIG